MTVENVSPEFLHSLEKSVCAFSDDSRLIYMVSHEERKLCISVYDVAYNKYVKMSTRILATELLELVEDQIPNFCVVDHQTLLILYYPDCFKGGSYGRAVLFLIVLDFTERTFSITDKLAYTNSLMVAYLLQDGNQLGLLHTTLEGEYWDKEYLAYCSLRINNNKIVQTQTERTLFDSDSMPCHPPSVHMYANKVWWCLWAKRGFKYEVFYFDLSQQRPVEVLFASFSAKNSPLIHWAEKNLVMYTTEKELSFLSLDSGNWSTVANSAELQKYSVRDPKLSVFCNDYRLTWNYTYHFDNQLNIIAIDKDERRMYQIPSRRPRKLASLAWTSALNSGSLDKQQFSNFVPKT